MEFGTGKDDGWGGSWAAGRGMLEEGGGGERNVTCLGEEGGEGDGVEGVEVGLLGEVLEGAGEVVLFAPCSAEESDSVSEIVMVLLTSLEGEDSSRKGAGGGGEGVLLGWLVRSLGRRAGGELGWEEEGGLLGLLCPAWRG